MDTMGQVDPKQTYSVSQNQFLAFAVLHLDDEGKANSTASAAHMQELPICSMAAAVLCAAPWSVILLFLEAFTVICTVVPPSSLNGDYL